MEYSNPSKRVHKKVKREASTHVTVVTTILTDTMEQLERVKNKVDRVTERLSLMCFAIRAIVERTNARTVELTKR